MVSKVGLLLNLLLTSWVGIQSAKVVDAQPQQVFDRAAIKAVERYKYKPKVRNGEAMQVHGVRQRIVFNLS